MKRIGWGILLLIVAMVTSAMSAAAQTPKQGLVGIWSGALDVGAQKLRLVLEITKSGEKLSGTLKSVDQGGVVIPLSGVTLTGETALIEIASIRGVFEAKLSSDEKTLTGDWTQGANTLPLTLTRSSTVPEMRRPQEPKPPFPYRSEDITYPSAQAGVTLAGTLTLPEGSGPFPVALLISGSGPQNRNEELLGHKPFLVLADYLTRQGIAVLRFDDRGVGKSTGSFSTATSADFANDVRGGVAYLKTRKEIDPKKIGLIGHSEGGLIAPMIAADSKDVAYIVLMAGPGLPGDEIILEQGTLIAKATGEPQDMITIGRDLSKKIYDIIKAEPNNTTAQEKIKTLYKETSAKLPENERKTFAELEGETTKALPVMLSAWFRYFLSYDPRTSLQKVACPVLAINGEKDLQVSPKQSLPEIEKALKAGGNTKFEVRELPGLNHLFQTTKTGSPLEYQTIEETISPVALSAIGDWIRANVK